MDDMTRRLAELVVDYTGRSHQTFGEALAFLQHNPCIAFPARVYVTFPAHEEALLFEPEKHRLYNGQSVREVSRTFGQGAFYGLSHIVLSATPSTLVVEWGDKVPAHERCMVQPELSSVPERVGPPSDDGTPRMEHLFTRERRQAWRDYPRITRQGNEIFDYEHPRWLFLGGKEVMRLEGSRLGIARDVDILGYVVDQIHAKMEEYARRWRRL